MPALIRAHERRYAVDEIVDADGVVGKSQRRRSKALNFSVFLHPPRPGELFIHKSPGIWKTVPHADPAASPYKDHWSRCNQDPVHA